MVAYGNPQGNPQLKDQGWTVHGDGGVATAAAFNLLGGTVEFDIDLSAVNNGVNANVYTISPHFKGSKFNKDSDYCDGAMKGPWCLEVDWIESNGHCGGATTLHSKEQNGGMDGCTSWGCRTSYEYNGKTSFHMKIEYGTDGTWTTIRDGQVIDGGTMSPHVGSDSWAVVKSTYESRGGVIYSSEWIGWVPESPPCPGNAGKSELASSHFTVSNLKITGSVVQGPTPKVCGSGLEIETVII